MSYLDLWKKKMISQGGSENGTRVKTSKDLITREFKNDPSYKSAILCKLNLDEEPIDIRLKNVDRTTSEKKILFLPNSKIDIGSFIKFDGKVFLTKEFEDNSLSPFSKAILCNQTLNWYGLDKPIPCWCDNSSYGTKGVVDTNLITEYDGKILFYTQYNEKTAKIRQDMRFLFDHDKNAVYEVVDINRVVTGNVLRLVMDKSEVRSEYDDAENNIAYNEFLMNEEIPTPSQGYVVKAYSESYDINRWSTNKFTVCYEDGTEDSELWNISIDYKGNSTDIVRIVSTTNNSILLESTGVMGKEIELIFTKEDIEIRQVVRLVK